MAGYKFVASQNASAASSGAAVSTAAINTTGATLIVLAVSNLQSNTPSVSDNQSNTWTGLTRQSVSAAAAIQLFYCFNPTINASHTFTVGAATNNLAALTAIAFSGALTSPFDQQNGASTSGNATSQSTGSITPTVDSALIVAALATAETNPFTVLAIDGSSNPLPFVKITDINTVGGTHFSQCFAWAIQGAKIAESVTFSWSTAGSAGPCAAIASFKPTVASSGGSGGAWAFA